jgi:holo-[acyl-carrier protein] synthase
VPPINGGAAVGGGPVINGGTGFSGGTGISGGGGDPAAVGAPLTGPTLPGPSLVVPSLVGLSVVGLGIDLVDVERFAAVLARRPRLADRLFSAGEQAYAGSFADPTQSLAARFAAKEAVMKALGVGLGAFAFRDVEVQRQPSGAPELVLTGRAATLASEREVRSWMISLTHTSSTAAALVVAQA